MLSHSDSEHERARAAFELLLATDEPLLTHNYILVETLALAQSRLGLEAVALLRDDIFPVLQVLWVDRALHAEALASTIAAGPRAVSFVDRVSFELMRQTHLERAFAFDQHFVDQGFHAVATR